MFSCKKDDDNNPMPNPQTIATPAELTIALTRIYNETEAPGFAVSVVKNDEVLYQKSFGKADIEMNKAYTNQTTQPIGSVSKTFVAAAIVKSIEQGHFTLETDLNNIRVLPGVTLISHLISGLFGRSGYRNALR